MLPIFISKQEKISNNSNTIDLSNHKDIGLFENKDIIEQKLTFSDKIGKNEEININMDLEEETNELTDSDNNPKNEKDEISKTESQEIIEDPRRKRRRSSASS